MTLPDEAVLIIDGGPDAGKSIPLSGGTTTFGREADNDVVVDEEGVAPQHGQISTEVSYYLTDLSSNGTFVNGENLGGDNHALNDGDRFSLHSSEVTFIFRGGDPPTLNVEGGPDSGKTMPLAGGTTMLGVSPAATW